MRKLLLTTAFVLPLSMVPVFAQDAAAPAEDPAATEPMESETTPMPADPAAGDDAMADAAAEAEGEMEADPAAEQAAMEAEVAASGKVAQQQAANELRLDWITDASVTSPDGTTIGDINDLIVDGQSGQMIAAVIGVGGFLGIGEKQIAVPWDQLTVNYDAQEINSNLTPEEADAAQEYVFRDREAAPAAVPAEDPAAADAAMEPAEGEAAMDMPAEEAMEPADTMEATDDMAPAEGEMAPAEGEAAPADAMESADEAPMEGEAAPADEAPMDGEAAEGEEEAPASN